MLGCSEKTKLPLEKLKDGFYCCHTLLLLVAISYFMSFWRIRFDISVVTVK
eukprot:m.57349 g.57349  ORF g.57349 m.57349 type:complete len:51 (+) comp11101_c0_seq1:508-660(+)